MSSSYGVVNRSARTFIIVNAEPDDHMDYLIELEPDPGNRNMDNLTMRDYDEDIKLVLFNDEYEIYRMTFTANNGSVVSATFSEVPDSEQYDPIAKSIARLVLWCESIYNDSSKAIEDAVKVSRLGEEELEHEENCGICLEEYKAEDMMGTLKCKHRYHHGCIKNWLRRKEDCPLCRGPALLFDQLFI